MVKVWRAVAGMPGAAWPTLTPHSILKCEPACAACDSRAWRPVYPSAGLPQPQNTSFLIPSQHH